jgi:hypothetical protein
MTTAEKGEKGKKLKGRIGGARLEGSGLGREGAT